MDVDAFTQAAEAAGKAPTVPSHERAIALYAGDLLPEDRYDDWVSGHRERLLRVLLSLYLGLAQLQEAAGNLQAAAHALEAAVHRDGLDEDIHARLIHLYWRLGQRERAIRHYERLEDLRRDLAGAHGPAPAALLEVSHG